MGIIFKLKKIWFKLTWFFSRKPLGARIFIMRTFIDYIKKHDVTALGMYYPFPLSYITLGAKYPPSINIIIQIMHHEILHFILDKRISWEASKCLDKIQVWDYFAYPPQICFKGVEFPREKSI